MWNGLEALCEHLFSGGVFIISITNHDVRALATESRFDALETTVFTCHAHALHSLSFKVILFPDVFMRDGRMSHERSTEHDVVLRCTTKDTNWSCVIHLYRVGQKTGLFVTPVYVDNEKRYTEIAQRIFKTVTYNTPVLLRIKYWTVWYIERYSMSTCTWVTNFQKTVWFFMGHPVCTL